MIAPGLPGLEHDERTPVTVMLDLAQLTRLEIAITELRALFRNIDDNDIADFVFGTGLCTLEITLRRLAAAPDHFRDAAETSAAVPRSAAP